MSSANLKIKINQPQSRQGKQSKPQKQARLANSGVADEKELEKVVTEIMILLKKNLFILPPLPHLTVSADGRIFHLIFLFLLTIRGSL